MIKYFCDRCGKEIKDTMYTETETTEAIDCHDNVVATFTRTMYYCDECKYEELSCGFKVGDKVITNDGRTGVISAICTCDTCKQRGFYEPTVAMDDDSSEYIMISDKKNGFKSYYSIGDRVFGNLDEKSVNKELEEIGERYNQLVKQQSVIYYLRTKKENNNGN